MTNPWHRLPRRLKKPVIILGSLAAFISLASLGTVIGFDQMRPAVPTKVDAVIVLGARVGTPALKERTLTGLTYFYAGKTDTIVLSGAKGSNEPISEAQAMADVVKADVAKTGGTMPRLILETRSNNTQQNINNSHALLPSAHNVIVVSDGYHLARSVLLARHADFETVYLDAPKPSYYATVDLMHYYVREAVALVVHAPQYL